MLYAFTPRFIISIIELKHCISYNGSISEFVTIHICLLPATVRGTRKLWAVRTVCLLNA
jgi:hypothetical protein